MGGHRLTPYTQVDLLSGQLSHLPHILSVYKDVRDAAFPTRSLAVEEATAPVNDAVTNVLSGKCSARPALKKAARDATTLLGQDQD